MKQGRKGSIAEMVGEAMMTVNGQGKDLNEMETAVQQAIGEVANRVLEEVRLPARISQIQLQVQEGQIRCQQWGSKYQCHRCRPIPWIDPPAWSRWMGW